MCEIENDVLWKNERIKLYYNIECRISIPFLQYTFQLHTTETIHNQIFIPYFIQVSTFLIAKSLLK